ncbi:hypothetical protein D3C80_1693290 [compost metagenome]
MRFDDLAHDVVVVPLAQAGQHLDVFGLFVSLLDGLDLALGIRHQRDHFRVIFHRHDLACDRVRGDVSQQVEVAVALVVLGAEHFAAADGAKVDRGVRSWLIAGRCFLHFLSSH